MKCCGIAISRLPPVRIYFITSTLCAKILSALTHIETRVTFNTINNGLRELSTNIVVLEKYSGIKSFTFINHGYR